MKITADSVVTGGTGFLGRWLVTSLTRQGRRVAVVARGGAARAPELQAFVTAHGGDADKLVVVDGDLGAPGLGLETTLDGVRDVYHLAAVFAFGQTSEQVRAINVEGTRRVAEWALSQPELRRVVHLGGYRVTRMPTWLLEAPWPLPPKTVRRLYREHGAYEASKYESHLVMQHFAEERGLPLTAVHPSTVIGSSVTGESSQLVGIGETVEKLWRGDLPALAGSPRTFLPLVSVDYLADFLASVPTREQTLGQQLCVLDQSTPRLPQLIEQIGAHLGVAAPRLILPIGLVGRLPSSLTGLDREALEFLVEDDYDTRSAEAHADAIGLRMPALGPTVARWVSHLVATRFGRTELVGSAHFRSVAGSRTFVVGDPDEAPTLFLHGLPWDSQSGQPLAAVMVGEVARADLPGMGRSSPSNASDVQWLTELLAARREPVRIIAHSLAAGIALRYAAAQPDQVRDLVLISPFFLQQRAPWYLRCSTVTARLLRVGDATAMQRRMLGTSDAAASAQPAVQSAHENLTRPGVAARVARALSRASQVAERESLRQDLLACTRPVLLVHGERDELLFVPPSTSVVRIEGTGHNPHVEQPALVAAAVDRWRGSRSATGPATPPPPRARGEQLESITA